MHELALDEDAETLSGSPFLICKLAFWIVGYCARVRGHRHSTTSYIRPVIY